MDIIRDIIITTTVAMTTKEFESLDEGMAFHDLQVREKVRLILPEFDTGVDCAADTAWDHTPPNIHRVVSFHSNSRKDADQIVAELKAIILQNVRGREEEQRRLDAAAWAARGGD